MKLRPEISANDMCSRWAAEKWICRKNQISVDNFSATNWNKKSACKAIYEAIPPFLAHKSKRTKKFRLFRPRKFVCRFCVCRLWSECENESSRTQNYVVRSFDVVDVVFVYIILFDPKRQFEFFFHCLWSEVKKTFAHFSAARNTDCKEDPSQ